MSLDHPLDRMDPRLNLLQVVDFLVRSASSVTIELLLCVKDLRVNNKSPTHISVFSLPITNLQTL